MAGAHDLLRRSALLGALVATVVSLMAPAARADDASAAVAAATGAAIAEQAQPANVNVSVRVDSPGENGSVTQANDAGASAAGGVSAGAGSAQAGRDDQRRAPNPPTPTAWYGRLRAASAHNGRGPHPSRTLARRRARAAGW